MKLYHGTTANLNVGDMLRTDKSESVGIGTNLPAVYATSLFKMAMDYTVAPMNHEKLKRNISYLPFANIILVRGKDTGQYVYRVDDNGFSKIADYSDDGDMVMGGDEWISDKDATIIEKIELTPDVLAENGYNVRMARGKNKILRAVNFKLASMTLSCKMYGNKKDMFDKLLNVFTGRTGDNK